MAAVELNIQPRLAISALNMGTVVVKQGGTKPQLQLSSSLEQSVKKGFTMSEVQVSEKNLKTAVDQANIEIVGSNENITFGYEARLGMLFVQVTDNKSGEVIREIPSRDFIKHQIAMREMIGLLLDKQV